MESPNQNARKVGFNVSTFYLNVDQPIQCTSNERLTILWEAIASWSRQTKYRVHFEWIWDGSYFWLVQADKEHITKGIGPRSANIRTVNRDWNETNSQFSLKTLRLAKDLPKGLSPKADSLKLFNKHHLPLVPIWGWHQTRSRIRALAQYQLAKDLQDDLSALLTKPLVIRTDIHPSDVNSNNLFLPHSGIINTISEAINFLKDISCRIIDGEWPPNKDVVFLTHHYVPSRSAALCYAEPESDVVLVESTWGLPDGLQYCAHDSFLIQNNGLKIISRRIRHKESIIDITESGNWSIRSLGCPWDWKQSLTDEEACIIARETANVSRGVRKRMQIMWFSGIRGKNIPNSLPWHALATDDAPTRLSGLTPPKSHAFSKYVSVQSKNDLVIASRQLENLKGCPALIDLRPRASLLRSHDFLASVASIANHFNTPVLLQGSILSHAYYILRRAGVLVLPPDEITWTEEI